MENLLRTAPGLLHNVQILLPLSTDSAVVSDTGIHPAPGGVEHFEAQTPGLAARSAAAWKTWLLLALGAVSLVGQGERCQVDPQLRAPGSAIAFYWQALQSNDAERVAACSLVSDPRLPFPGMLWAFPNTHALAIEHLRYVPIDADYVVVSYDVVYRPVGGEQDQTLAVMTEVVRVRGEWRVARPLAEPGIMNGLPPPTRVDI